jgi:hypothetical protein
VIVDEIYSFLDRMRETGLTCWSTGGVRARDLRISFA